ncbi:hypothetical protein [Phormidium sp. FACHB-592]|nr:hypothetical protein [Phormidium sp. FACHB-592]
MLTATITPEISCRRDGALRQCKVIRHMLGNWRIEQPISIKGIRDESSGGFRRGKSNGGSSTHITVVETQSGEIWLVNRPSTVADSATTKIQRFLNDPTQTSVQIRSVAWLHLNEPVSNGFWFMFSIVMFVIAYQRLVNQRIYRCEFDKTRDLVRVTQQGLLTSKTIEFPISKIRAIHNVKRLGRNYIGSDCVVLKLRSAQEDVYIGEAVWGKKTMAEHYFWGSIRFSKALEEGRQAIVSFLQD